jgi:hypothetical protein
MEPLVVVAIATMVKAVLVEPTAVTATRACMAAAAVTYADKNLVQKAQSASSGPEQLAASHQRTQVISNA